MKFKKPKNIKKNQTQINPKINNATLDNNMNLEAIVENNYPVNINNQQPNNQLTQQQGQNQTTVNNQIKAIQQEYWKLYNYYCARFAQYCRAVTNSYQRYINDMIRNTVQQSLQAKMYQGQNNANNSFGELNSSLSNLLYYKLIDNLVNNNNQNHQYQQPLMMPQYPNPAQFANFAPFDNQQQPVTANLMANPNQMANNQVNNPVNNSVNNPVNNNLANVETSKNNIDVQASEQSSSLLSPEITNRFRNKLDKILEQQSMD